MLTIRPIPECMRAALAGVVRIGAVRADCRAERLSREIVMPPAKRPALAARKTAAPAKGAAKQAAPAKAAPPSTITLKHMAAALAQAHNLSKKTAETVLGDFVALITRQLVKGDKIRLSGLGILQVRDQIGRAHV